MCAGMGQRGGSRRTFRTANAAAPPHCAPESQKRRVGRHGGETVDGIRVLRRAEKRCISLTVTSDVIRNI